MMSYDEWKLAEPQDSREYEDGPREDYSDQEYLDVWHEDQDRFLLENEEQ